MIRTFICATGTAKNHSPRGVFKITYKEKGWFYTSTKELYVTHYKGRNSFHTRPLWNNGSVQNPTIGKPASIDASAVITRMRNISMIKCQ